MAKIVEMINPLTGLPEQVDKLDHTAQEIDDAVGLAPQLSNPNLLDNWYFVNPVNQRGQTSYTASGYGIDRWKANGSTVTVTVVDGEIQVIDNSIDWNGIVQLFENWKDFAGKTVTLSALGYTVGVGHTLHLQYGDNTTIASKDFSRDTFGLVSFTVKIPDSIDSQFKVRTVRTGNQSGNSTLHLKALKLELGTVQTLAHQDENGNWVLNEIPDYGEQLRRCQRYFWRSWTGDRNTHNSILGVVFGTNNRITGFDYPIEMRTKPSITVYGLTGAGKVTEFASDADYGPASPAYWDTQRCVALACDGAGLSNDNRVYYFIEANAEL